MERHSVTKLAGSDNNTCVTKDVPVKRLTANIGCPASTEFISSAQLKAMLLQHLRGDGEASSRALCDSSG